jgi:alanyl-tRNA synthetase
LIRRAARQGRILGLQEPFLYELLQPLAQGHGELLSVEEREQIAALTAVFITEERQFSHVLSSGLRFLDQLEPDGGNVIAGGLIFQLQAEKGFPADLAVEILAERGLTVAWDEFEDALARHREVSRQSVSSHFRMV